MAMALVEELKQVAAGADRKAGQLAQDEAQRLARREAYNKLGQIFDEMAADGVLDASEIEALHRHFRDAGLDTETLEQLVQDMAGGDRVQVTTQLRNEISDTLREAKRDTDSGPAFQLEVQRLMGDHNEAINLAATVQKKEHDMYMTAINNMKA